MLQPPCNSMQCVASNCHCPALLPRPAVKADKDYSKEDFCDDFGIEWLVVISLNEDWVSAGGCVGGCCARRLRGLWLQCRMHAASRTRPK